MNRLLLAAAILLAVGASSARAQSCTTDASGNVFCDPTSFHVTDSIASGHDPVFLNEGTTFNVDDIDNSTNLTIDKPLKIYFAVPNEPGEGTPTVSKFDFDGEAFTTNSTALTAVGTWDPAGTAKADHDLYSFVGCTKCDGSIGLGSEEGLEDTLFKLSANTDVTFTVYSFTIQQDFTGNTDFETVDGAFPLGTIIAPLSEDVVTKNGKTTTTFYDTSWTNAGFENGTLRSISTPEPSTWVMFITGFTLLGSVGFAKRRNRLSDAI